MLRFVYLIIFISIGLRLSAEGTKQLRPAESDKGNIQINDGGRPFALETNTDTLHRLFIHINNTSEKIYFGFQPLDRTVGKATFRIKDPNGNVVYAKTNVPVASGDDGFIENYSEAVTGPQIMGLPLGGYKPLSLVPTIVGDYYIEFAAIGTYHFDIFDITVVDSLNNPKNGRLWSYAWDLNTQSPDARYNATMFVYTADRYTTSVNLNGIQPWGFVISCNGTGPRSTGNVVTNRKSVTGNQTQPKYKIFLNQPDPVVYPSATAPAMIEDLALMSIPITGSPVKFYLNMDKSGLVELFLGVDGILGYQPRNKDVVITKNIQAGGDTITWDGKDLTGAYVSENVVVEVNSRFSTGITHLPIFDAENQTRGFIVNRITPVSERASVYWDDSLISGTTNLIGASGNTDGHVWTGGFGDSKTLNTWWNGYENDNLKSFTFYMDGTGTMLPITLTLFTATIEDGNVRLRWQTASETDNSYFEIQRSVNGVDWEYAGWAEGAGNSTTLKKYTILDQEPLKGVSYYRLKQIDLDGKFSYSAIRSVSFPKEIIPLFNKFTASPNPALNSITIELVGSITDNVIDIYTIQGKSLAKEISIQKINDLSYSIDISKLVRGSYILSVNGDNNIFLKE